MELLNTKVKHTIFGEGTVIEFDGNYITVQFADKYKKFVYPDVFEKFIKAEDSTIQDTIMNIIATAKQAKYERLQTELVGRETVEERKATEKKIITLTARKTRNIEDGFGEDYHVEYLAKYPILTYQEVENQFNIKIVGFGRGINKTPSMIVLISSVDIKKSGFVYHDHWTKDGDYIYSGEGKTGDQIMSFGNRAIMEAKEDGKTIHLFVKFSPQAYYYQGLFELESYTYEDDLDENGNKRKEFKFKLRKTN